MKWDFVIEGQVFDQRSKNFNQSRGNKGCPSLRLRKICFGIGRTMEYVRIKE